MVNEAYPLEGILAGLEYEQISKNRWLHPNSTSGEPGIVLIDKGSSDGMKQYYSHHSSETDPLADGYTHDSFDLLCLNSFGGNVSKAVAHYAEELDPEGQKKRQKVFLDKTEKDVRTHSLDFISFKDMMKRKQHTEWLIKNILDSKSTAVLLGDPGTMKSFCTMDMGLCIASNTDWHGHKVKKSGSVFYIAGEGFAGISRRLKAWGKKHNLESADIMFFVSNTYQAPVSQE